MPSINNRNLLFPSVVLAGTKICLNATEMSEELEVMYGSPFKEDRVSNYLYVLDINYWVYSQFLTAVECGDV